MLGTSPQNLRQKLSEYPQTLPGGREEREGWENPSSNCSHCGKRCHRCSLGWEGRGTPVPWLVPLLWLSCGVSPCVEKQPAKQASSEGCLLNHYRKLGEPYKQLVFSNCLNYVLHSLSEAGVQVGRNLEKCFFLGGQKGGW